MFGRSFAVVSVALMVAVAVPVVPASAEDLDGSLLSDVDVLDPVPVGADSRVPSPPIADERGPIDDRFGLGVPGLDDQLAPVPGFEAATPALGRGGVTAVERAGVRDRVVASDEELAEIGHGSEPLVREPTRSWDSGASRRELAPGRSLRAPDGSQVRVDAAPGWAGESEATVRVLDPAVVAQAVPLGLAFEVRAQPGPGASRGREGGLSVGIDVSELVDLPANGLERVVVVQGRGCDLETGSCRVFEPVDSELDLSELVVRFDVTPSELRANEAERVAVTAGEVGSLGAASVEAFSAPASLGSVYALSVSVTGPSSDYSRAQLASLSSYQVGAQTGHAEFSYGFEVTPNQFGAQPQLGLAYSSGVVDGRVEGENNQPGLVGLGWSLTGMGSIVRHTEPCGSTDLCPVDGDLDEHFSLEMGGISGDLVRVGDPANPQQISVDGFTWDAVEYRIEDDPSVRVRRMSSLGGRPAQPVAIDSALGGGYWELGDDGSVYAYGGAGYHLGQSVFNGDMVDIEGRPDGSGYWLLGSDGGVFAKGTAVFHGSAGGLSLVAPVVGMDARSNGSGYVLAAADGGVFHYGYQSYGSFTDVVTSADPVVDIAVHPTGWGYWVVTRNGRVLYRTNDTSRVNHHGDLASVSNSPIVAIEATSDGYGYVLFAADGGTFAFGNAVFEGSGLGWFDEESVVDGTIARNSSGTSVKYWIQSDHYVHAANGDAFLGPVPSLNPDRAMTWWEVTTGDGTVMTFGRGGSSLNKYLAYSVDTVPMPETGLNTDQATAVDCGDDTYCHIGVRWQLDTITDTSGFHTALRYSQDRSYIRAGGNDRVYVRYTYPYEYRYGARDNLAYSWNMVRFIYASDRADVPTSLVCSYNRSVNCSHSTPAFYADERLSEVRNLQHNPDAQPGDPNWPAINSYFLAKTEVDGQMVLSSITRNSYHNDDSDLDRAYQPVNFTYESLPNRANGSNPVLMPRLKTAHTELGGLITFNYLQGTDHNPNTALCDPNRTSGFDTSAHTGECGWYITWDQNGQPGKWNKYRVGSVTFDDPQVPGTADGEITYDYLDGPYYAYSDIPGYDLSTTANCATSRCNYWRDYRGHRHVQVTTRVGSNTYQVEDLRFLTGLYHDRLAGQSSNPATWTFDPGDIATSATGAGAFAWRDYSWRAGFLIEQVSHRRTGTSGSLDTYEAVRYDPETAASAVIAGSDEHPDRWVLHTGNVHRYVPRDSGGWHRDRQFFDYDGYGNLNRIGDYGSAVTGDNDETTTYISYAPNTTAWIVSLPYETRTYSGAHGPGKPSSTLSIARSITYYDGGAYGSAPSVGRPTRQRDYRTNGTSNSSYFAYDSLGLLRTVTDPRGQVTTFTNDTRWGVVNSVRDPNGRTTSYRWVPEYGVVDRITDPDGDVTSITHDAFGRPIEVSLPDAPTGRPSIEYFYNHDRQDTNIVSTRTWGDASNYTQEWSFVDAFGRVLQAQAHHPTSASQRTITDYRYNHRGDLTQASVAYYAAGTPGIGFTLRTNWSTVTHDSMVIDPDGHAESTTRVASGGTAYASSWHHNDGDLQRYLDQRGNETRHRYDAHGRLIEVTEPNGGVTSYGYDLLDRLTTVDAPNVGGDANITTITYNHDGTRSSLDTPDSGLWSYTYDQAGNLQTQTDARGRTLYFVRDALARTTSIHQNNINGATLASYYWDPSGAYGQLSASIANNATIYYGYDNRDRVTSMTWDLPGLASTVPDTITQTWRADGNLATRTLPDGETLTYGYDRRFAPDELIGNTTYATGVTYAANGQLTALTRGTGANAVTETWSYNPTHERLQNHEAGVSTANDLIRREHEWDATGNLFRVRDYRNGGEFLCYEHDPNNQLTRAYTTDDAGAACDPADRINAGGGPGQAPFHAAWTYDLTGNITSAGGPGTLGASHTNRASYTYGAGAAGPHAVTSVAGNTYSYDANGNQTLRQITGQADHHLTYDDQGRLVSIGTTSGGDDVADYLYDADGTRIRRELADRTTWYLGDHVEIDLDTNGDLTTRTHYRLAGQHLATRTDYQPAAASASVSFSGTPDAGPLQGTLNNVAFRLRTTATTDPVALEPGTSAEVTDQTRERPVPRTIGEEAAEVDPERDAWRQRYGLAPENPAGDNDSLTAVVPGGSDIDDGIGRARGLTPALPERAELDGLDVLPGLRTPDVGQPLTEADRLDAFYRLHYGLAPDNPGPGDPLGAIIPNGADIERRDPVTATGTSDRDGRLHNTTTSSGLGGGLSTLTYTPGDGALTQPLNPTTSGGLAQTSTTTDILFVSATDPVVAADVAVVNRLIGAGYAVTEVADENYATANPASFDLIVISTSVDDQLLIGVGLDTIAVPVMVWEHNLFNDLYLSTTNNGMQSSSDSITIVDAAHPLAGGYTGDVTVVSTNAFSMSRSNAPSAAIEAARVTGTSNKSSIWGYDTGDTLTNGATAPARRVGWWWSYNQPAVTTTDGWALFDNAISWLLGGTGGGPVNQAPNVTAATTGTPADNGDGTWTVTLDGTVTDDGLPNPPATVTQTWTEATKPTGTTVTFTNPNAEDTTVVVDTPGDYTFTLTADDSALSQPDTTATITVTNGSSGGSDVLFVSATDPAPAPDQAVINRLTTNGYTVTPIADENYTTANPGTYDLIVISTSVDDSLLVGVGLDTIAVPVMVWEHNLFNDLYLSTTNNGMQSSSDSITIVDAAHPLAGGYTGDVLVVSSSAYSMSRSNAPSAAIEAARVTGTSNKSSIWGYDTGDTLTNGTTAPARRVGWWWSYDQPSYTTTDGWALFDDAITWLTAGTGGGGPTNQAPNVTATVTGIPADNGNGTWTITLDGTVTDDGLPTPPNLTQTWSRASGPGTATFTDATAQDTTVVVDTAGDYTFTLTANDTAATAAATTNPVTVAPGNQPPVVAASAANITDNGNGTWTITLDGTVTDDGLPTPPNLTQTWTENTKPTGATVTFTNPSAEDTTVVVDTAGDYTFTLTANDTAATASETTNSVTAAPASQPSSTLEWVLTDHLGSTSLLVNANSGTITHRARQYPYGTPRTTTGTSNIDQTFTGQTNDPGTGLIDYNARQYDPLLGRFVQPDTIAPDPARQVDVSRYTYVRNSPVRFSDPTGHDCYDAAALGLLTHCGTGVTVAAWEMQSFLETDAARLETERMTAGGADEQLQEWVANREEFARRARIYSGEGAFIGLDELKVLVVIAVATKAAAVCVGTVVCPLLVAGGAGVATNNGVEYAEDCLSGDCSLPSRRDFLVRSAEGAVIGGPAGPLGRVTSNVSGVGRSTGLFGVFRGSVQQLGGFASDKAVIQGTKITVSTFVETIGERVVTTAARQVGRYGVNTYL